VKKILAILGVLATLVVVGAAPANAASGPYTRTMCHTHRSADPFQDWIVTCFSTTWKKQDDGTGSRIQRISVYQNGPNWGATGYTDMSIRWKYPDGSTKKRWTPTSENDTSWSDSVGNNGWCNMSIYYYVRVKVSHTFDHNVRMEADLDCDGGFDVVTNTEP
jgi:hypothetical protein